MAFMCADKKRDIAPYVRNILKKFKMKGTLGVNNHSTLVLNIKSGKLDLLGNYEKMTNREVSYIQVNQYRINLDFDGECREFLESIVSAMNVGNHDNSRPEEDYFDVGWYISINVGKWNEPYVMK